MEEHNSKKVAPLSLIPSEDVIKGRKRNIVSVIKYIDAIEHYHKMLKNRKINFYEKSLKWSEPFFDLILLPDRELPLELRYILPEWQGKEVIIGDFRTGLRISRFMDSKQNRITGMKEFWDQYPYWKKLAVEEKRNRPEEIDMVLGKVGVTIFQGKIDENLVTEILFLIPTLEEKTMTISNILENIMKSEIEEKDEKPVEKIEPIVDLNNKIKEKDLVISDLNNKIKEKDLVISDLNNKIKRLEDHEEDVEENLTLVIRRDNVGKKLKVGDEYDIVNIDSESRVGDYLFVKMKRKDIINSGSNSTSR